MDFKNELIDFRLKQLKILTKNITKKLEIYKLPNEVYSLIKKTNNNQDYIILSSNRNSHTHFCLNIKDGYVFMTEKEQSKDMNKILKYGYNTYNLNDYKVEINQEDFFRLVTEKFFDSSISFNKNLFYSIANSSHDNLQEYFKFLSKYVEEKNIFNKSKKEIGQFCEVALSPVSIGLMGNILKYESIFNHLDKIDLKYFYKKDIFSNFNKYPYNVKQEIAVDYIKNKKSKYPEIQSFFEEDIQKNKDFYKKYSIQKIKHWIDKIEGKSKCVLKDIKQYSAVVRYKKHELKKALPEKEKEIDFWINSKSDEIKDDYMFFTRYGICNLIIMGESTLINNHVLKNFFEENIVEWIKEEKVVEDIVKDFKLHIREMELFNSLNKTKPNTIKSKI